MAVRKISGQVLSTKPISLSRAAKLISRFATALDHDSPPAVSLYLARTVEAFDHLVQFQKKRHVGNEPDRNRVQKLQADWLEKDTNPDGEKGATVGEEGTNNVTGSAAAASAETTPTVVDEAQALSSEGEEKSKENKKKKKDKKRKSESVDSGEEKKKKNRSSKKKSTE